MYFVNHFINPHGKVLNKDISTVWINGALRKDMMNIVLRKRGSIEST